MTSIIFSDRMTIIFVIVDHWFQAYGQKYLQGKAGRKPVFSENEVMTLMLIQEFLPFPSETQFIESIRANYVEVISWVVSSTASVLVGT